MPYTLIHNGVMREFDFYAPPGWEHWVGEAWAKGRRGLPLIVALHGGGEDPLVFQKQWFFPQVWNLGLDTSGNPSDPVRPLDPRFLENQFFVLYPYGQGWMTKSLYELAYGLAPLPASLDTQTLRAFDPGFAGSGPLVDDVDFIKAARDAMDEKLRTALGQAASRLPNDFPLQTVSAKLPTGEVVSSTSSSISLFDPSRRFLFGYSNGAMLGYRLVREMPNHWAALWAMSGTCGGIPHYRVSAENDRVVNLPEDGTFAVSLFAHHGEADVTVPPGDMSAEDFAYQTPIGPDLSKPLDPSKFQDYLGYLTYAFAGFPNALDYSPGYLPLAQASRGFRAYNSLKGQNLQNRQRTDLNGGSTAHSLSFPDSENPDDFNPMVVIYRDPTMDHTNFNDKDKIRYFFEKDVWRFFSRHSRTLLLQPSSHQQNPNIP